MNGRLIAGRYRLSEPLAAGGMGQVWKARDETLNLDVAINHPFPAIPGAEEDASDAELGFCFIDWPTSFGSASVTFYVGSHKRAGAEAVATAAYPNLSK